MKTRFSRRLLISILALLLSSSCAVFSGSQGKQYFVAYPYLQLGYEYSGDSLSLIWLTEDKDTSELLVEYKTDKNKDWIKAAPLNLGEVNGYGNLYTVSATFRDLAPSSIVDYQISKSGKVIFQASTKSPAQKGKSFDFAVFGDIGQGSSGQSRIAALLSKKAPCLAILTGDLVYPIGSVGNYLRHFFPFMNDDTAARGSPLFRSTLAVAAPGNHDLTTGGGIDARDLDLAPDSLSYFVFWKQPLNGPLSQDGSNCTVARGSKERIADFTKAAGQAYPRMSNFSFDYGDCHFLILDANAYMDWTDEKLRNWVESDLKGSRAKWKFVAYHQPGFNSDFSHREEQRMRHLADVFEKCNVDIAFAGHSHSYQRSYPLHFKEIPARPGDLEAAAGYVNGTFKLDASFDGVEKCRPDGVIYLVTGAGGARLSKIELEAQPALWLPFTKVFACSRHSATLCHVESNRLTVEQVADDGNVIDKFSLVK